jgi:hypothetical protein
MVAPTSAAKAESTVAMDWTDFDADDHATIMLTPVQGDKTGNSCAT